MAGDQNDEGNQAPAEAAQRQPVFLLPAWVTGLCAILIAIQAAQSLVLNEAGQQALLGWLAFFPYRLIDPAGVEGGWLPLLWTPVTHAFLHAGWEHLGLNVVWLAIFATPVARRYGGPSMLALFLIGAVVGAIAFAATTLPQPQVLVGASGGIAALTGAATRFIFQPVVVGVDPNTGQRVMLGRRLATLGEVLRNPTARFFSLVWIVLNGIVPLLPMFTGGEGVEVAWQAHLGGFIAGMLIVPLFERSARNG
jgi:membrane associated rhomboid family serine protease